MNQRIGMLGLAMILLFASVGHAQNPTVTADETEGNTTGTNAVLKIERRLK